MESDQIKWVFDAVSWLTDNDAQDSGVVQHTGGMVVMP